MGRPSKRVAGDGGSRGIAAGLALLVLGVGIAVAAFSRMVRVEGVLGVVVLGAGLGLVVGGGLLAAISLLSVASGDDRPVGPHGASPPPSMTLSRPLPTDRGDRGAAVARTCWLCGGRVKAGGTMCMHCGASQPPVVATQPAAPTARVAGRDPYAASDANAARSSAELGTGLGPPPSVPAADATAWAPSWPAAPDLARGPSAVPQAGDDAGWG